MSVREFFPLAIDSTFLMEFDSCEMSGFRKYIQHLNSEESTDLIAGGALAAGLETARKLYFDDDYTEQDAIAEGVATVFEKYGDHIPTKEKKSVERIAGALEMYFIEYPMATDQAQPALLENGKHGIEYSFACELPFEHPDLPGQALHIVGRADMLAEYAGRLYVLDEKTTGGYFTKNWAQSWDTRGQFTTYCTYLRKEGIETAGAIIRGISFGGKEIKFAETVSTRSKYQCEIWEKQMLQKVERILTQYKKYKDSGKDPAEYFFGAWNESCTKYFRNCQFQDLCRSRNSNAFVEGQFDQNIWLPHLQTRMPLNQFLDELENKK